MRDDMYRISFECNETAKDNLVPLLKYFEMMGNLGMTRDFVIDELDNKWFIFDGDGPDKLKNITVSELKKINNVKYTPRPCKIGKGKCDDPKCSKCNWEGA